MLEESDGLWCQRRRISLKEQVLRLFADLRPGVSHSGCGEERSRWSEIYGRQTGKDRWKGNLKLIVNCGMYDAF